MTEAKHPSQQVESAEPPDRTASYTWRAVSGHNNLIITNTNQSPSSQPVWLQSTVELQGRTGLPLNTNKTTRQFSFWSISPTYLLEWLTDCGHRWHRTCHWCLSNLCFYHLADWTFSSGKNKSCSHCSKDTIGPGPISPRNLCKSWRRTLISDPAGLSRFRAHCNPHNLTFLHPGPQSEKPNLPENSHPGTFRAASVSLRAANDPWTLTEKLTDSKTDHRLPSLC